MRIRLIASNRPTQSILLTALRNEGLTAYSVSITRPRKGLNEMVMPFGAIAIEAETVDAAVLDSVQSALDGMRAMASQLLSTPVVVVVKRASAKDRCNALDAGADDVLVAPDAPGDIETSAKAVHDRMRTRRAA